MPGAHSLRRKGTPVEAMGTAGGARGKGRPKLTETAEIDRAIREAGLQVLLEHGEAATMNAVALAAGLSRKTVYARYANKTELFLAVIRELLGGVQGLEYDTSGSIEEKLEHYALAALGVISQPQALAIQRLLTIDPAYIAVLRAEMLGATMRIFFDPLQALLGAAKDSGELAVENVDATTRAVIRLIFSESAAMGPDAVPIPPADQAAYAAFITRLVTRGLLPR